MLGTGAVGTSNFSALLSSLSGACTNPMSQCCKGVFFVHCDIRQHFTVNLYPCLLETSDKAAVRQAMFTGGSIDAHNPQTTELTLTLASVTVGVLTGLDNGLFSYLKGTTTSAVITFGSF